MRQWLSCQVHLILAGVWVLLTVPTCLWWKNSILWVLIISIYANVASHWSAWEGKRAGRYAREQSESSGCGTPCADCPGES